MQSYMSKHVDEIRNDFERGIFINLYNSRKQRFNRALAGTLLVVKHGLRGMLFSWPLYLLALAVYVVPGSPALVFLLFLLPGVYMSWVILSRGVREDYDQMVSGYLLRSGFIGRMLFHTKT